MIEFQKSIENIPQRFLFYLLLLLFTLLLGIVSYKKNSKAFKYLSQLITITFITEYLSYFHYKVISVNFLGLPEKTNFPIYHLLQVIQVFYIGLIYSQLFKHLKQPTKNYKLITYLLCSVIIIISFTIQPIAEFPSYSSIIQSLFFIFSALLLFYRMIQNPKTTPILLEPVFWFNSGNLFFYSVTFIIYGYYQDFRIHQISTPLWANYIIAGANYILYPCYLISIILNAYQYKNARSF